MTEPQLHIHRRNLPHWELQGSTYFITFRSACGTLTSAEQQIVLDHLRSGHGTHYTLAAAVVMPDHVHLLLKPKPEFTLSRVMKGIKGVSARKINLLRGCTGSVWQIESWDRIVRDAAEFDEKLQYMAGNPVKAGLVRTIEEYPYWHCDKELC